MFQRISNINFMVSASLVTFQVLTSLGVAIRLGLNTATWKDLFFHMLAIFAGQRAETLATMYAFDISLLWLNLMGYQPGWGASNSMARGIESDNIRVLLPPVANMVATKLTSQVLTWGWQKYQAYNNQPLAIEGSKDNKSDTQNRATP